MQRKHERFSMGEYYHIYNRGTDKREIFSNNYDYERFIKLLYISNSTKNINLRDVLRQRQSLTEAMLVDKGEELVSIGAYVLMPNHFHILLTPKIEDGVSIFMKKLCTAYSKYFNLKYKRNGSLFQGPFKSEHVDKDNYLKYLFSYIHLNPIKLITGNSNWKEEGLGDINVVKDFLKKFTYSSYLDYTEKNDRAVSKIINKPDFPEYFITIEDSIREINDWLTLSKTVVDEKLVENN